MPDSRHDHDAFDLEGMAPRRSTRPLLVGLLVMLLLVGGGMGMGIYQLRQITQTMDSAVSDDAAAIGSIIAMMRSARERALVLSDAVTMTDPFDRDEKLFELDHLKGQFQTALTRLTALPLSREEAALRVSQNRLLSQQASYIEQALSLIREGQLADAERFIQTTVIPSQSLVLDSLMHWVDIRRTQQHERVEQMRNQQQQAASVMVAFGLVAMLVGATVVFVVYRWNTRLFSRLAEDETRLRTTLAQLALRQHALDAHSIVSEADAQGRITYVNDKFCEVSEYSREALIGANHRIVKSDFHPPEFFEDMWKTISSGRVWHGEVKNRAKSGRLYWVDTTIVPMLDEHGLPIQYISVRTDITDIMEMEEAVRQANVILKSNVLERTQQLEQAKQQLEQELQERVQTQAALQHSYDELKTLHQQLQDTQQYLMQSEKLAAVGQLAAGMAHEINNPIGFVTSNLAMLGRYQATLGTVLSRYQQLESGLDEDSRASLAALRKETDLDFVLEDTRALLGESREGVERVRKIVQDLRDFSRQDSAGQWQPVNVNQCLNSTVNLLGGSIAEGVNIRRVYGQLPDVLCSPADLNQVFLNVLNNALQAVREKGSIILRSGVDGDQVWVEIEDTGEGISAEALPHVFEPFFTTRPVGQGAGLGLSMAYGVIQKHGGQITVSSQPGVGSTFRITLPQHQHGVVPAIEEGASQDADMRQDRAA